MKKTYVLLSPHLDERTRRLWCAAQAQALGHGGVTRVQEATGVSRSCLTRGMTDLAASPFPEGAVRRPGGGRKRVTEHDPALLADLDALIEPTKRGDPMRGLRWTCKSTRHLAGELTAKGHAVSHTTVAEELHLQQYSLKGNRKTQEGASHPDRNAQFLHIHETVERVPATRRSGDLHRYEEERTHRELQEWGAGVGAKGTPREVKVHDFLDKQLGKAIPYGVYDIAKNPGFVSVGIDHDTGEFAVQTIRRWWTSVGREAYPKSTQLYLTADGGGSNASRSRLFKLELQKLADETRLRITVSHYPPGTSKWNKIEHRMFCHITANWRAVPLESREIIVELISHTTTEKGLSIQAELDTNTYEKGRVVTKKEFAALALTREAFHGEWNYTLAPRHKMS